MDDETFAERTAAYATFATYGLLVLGLMGFALGFL
jgi:hypothetical protein